MVARMVIEVRSDGLRTRARGALEDLVSEQTVAVELPAMTPGQLGAEVGAALGRLLGGSPGLGRAALGALVPERLRRLKRRVLGRPREPAG
ncbi:MAG: hypothetical protein D6731_04225 [Planctomycetota bacterium]|nr:MAG: hypothetical protein D6731_04225 [Planctomycetota bacterium]